MNKNFHETLKNYFVSQKMTQNDVAERLNLSRTIVSNYLNGQKNFGRHSAMKWANTFGIDAVWLMTQGERGKDPTLEKQPQTPIHDNNVINVPIINLDVRGGLFPNDETDVSQYTLGTMPFNRNIATEGDFVAPVFGDSMSPRYPSGSYILLRPLPLWREWLEFGNPYVLELADLRRTIKIVRKGLTPDTYRLECYNPDYDTTEIPTSIIKNVFQVLAVFKREIM